MTINLGEKWRRLLQHIRDFRSDLADTGPQQTQTESDKLAQSCALPPRFENDFARTQFRERSESPPEIPGPVAVASAYRSKPDPAFGCRSAAQRRTYEAQQLAREEEAGAMAALHSQQRHAIHEQGSHGHVCAGEQASGSGHGTPRARGRH